MVTLRTHGRVLGLLAVALLAVGCSGGGASPEVEQADASPPETVVSRFLEAVRTGDDKEAFALLTPLARRKTTESAIVVAPPGSETASFEILDVQLADEVARVTALWSDLGLDGRSQSDRLVWILRKDALGWRISGVAMPVFGDRPPVELNFEDPQEMLRKEQVVAEELARQENERRRQLQEAAGAPDNLRR